MPTSKQEEQPARQLFLPWPTGWARACFGAAVVFAGADAYIYRDLINPDGIAYLDIASQVRDGSLDSVLNAYWSGLYPTLLALITALFRPSPNREFQILHLANWLIFVMAALFFNKFLKTVYWESGQVRLSAFQARVGIAVSFCVFWSLNAASVRTSSPDILLVAIIPAVATVAYRIASRPRTGLSTGVILGSLLALGYFAKAATLPAGIFLLMICGIETFNKRHNRACFLLAGIVWISLSCLLIAGLTAKKGHLTFGDAGPLNYAWMVGHVPAHTGWLGGVGEGMPLHGPRVLLLDPKTIEFGNPISGTYPLWYDPSYWYEGVRGNFSIGNQLTALYKSALASSDLLSQFTPLVSCVISLFILSGKRYFSSTFRQLLLVGWPAVVILMYALVALELRYVSPFIALIAIEALWSSQNGMEPKVWAAAILFVIPGVLLQPLKSDLRELFGVRSSQETTSLQLDLKAAKQMNELDVGRGAKIAVIGHADVFFPARPARVQIVAQVTDETGFWSSPPEKRQKVLQLLWDSGVTAIVAMNPPVGVPLVGWRPLANNDEILLRAR